VRPRTVEHITLLQALDEGAARRVLAQRKRRPARAQQVGQLFAVDLQVGAAHAAAQLLPALPPRVRALGSDRRQDQGGIN